MTAHTKIRDNNDGQHALRERALDVLRHTFGYPAFRPWQEDIIGTVAGGDDALVIMPTGGGKSLCYQIPALLRNGVGIIVSPLIALMQDQVMALREAGVAAAMLNSALDSETAAQVERELLAGKLQMVYVAPERLATPRFLDLLTRLAAQNRLALFAIDEAHCVSQWGHDFRPEYLQLSLLHERFPDVPRIALTATADIRTRQEIAERLALQDARLFVTGFDRPNISYHIHAKQSGREQLLRFIRSSHAGDAGIVYCLSRAKVEETAAWLCEQGFNALPYHAGLGNDIRETHQRRFINEDAIIMVATIAFGMGIDKPDVRFVAHLDLPRSLEAYYQETGRAGRDGLPATAWMVYGLQDAHFQREMIDRSELPEAQKRIEHTRVMTLLGFCETTQCRRSVLLGYFSDPQATGMRCGNCDNCLFPPQTYDGLVVAQKALSCVYRTGQRFGVGYLVDVLRGKDDERIRQCGHHSLGVFGIGADIDDKQWRSIFRQLIAAGLLDIAIDQHGALRLTEAARPVLRGECGLTLRAEQKATKRNDRKRSLDIGDADQALWDALRACRRDLAREHNVPPYVIFHDATLKALLELRPQSLREMAGISGIGDRKLDAYGDAFLDVLRQFD